MTEIETEASSTLIALTAGTMEESTMAMVDGEDRIVGRKSPSSLMKKNMERCQAILECRRQIKFWQSKLDVLEMEHERCQTLQFLQSDPWWVWDDLTKEEQCSKEFILAALASPPDCDLPRVLKVFPNSAESFPKHIRNDKTIFLARIARDDVEEMYCGSERLFVPRKLRGDKEVILAVLPKHPAVIECMSSSLRDDDDVFEAVLDQVERESSDLVDQRSKSPRMGLLPTNFLQHFSTRIRSSRSMMMRLCCQRTGLSSLSFVSIYLRNDKKFMMDVIVGWPSTSQKLSSKSALDKHGPCTLKKGFLYYASPRLRDDRDLVLAAVQVSGMFLQHASSALRRDPEIVHTAMNQDTRSFRFVLPGKTKTDSLRSREIVLNQILKKGPISRSVFRGCVEKYPGDREVVLSSLRCLDMSTAWEWERIVPKEFEDDHQFVKDALNRNSKIFLHLPTHFKSDRDLALHAFQTDQLDGNVILEATEHCPLLLSDRNAMLSIAKSGWANVFEDTLQFSPVEIRGDRDIMIEAVSTDTNALAFCTNELLNDRDFILRSIDRLSTTNLQKHPFIDFFEYIDVSFVQGNPDIFIRVFESFPFDQFHYLQRDVTDVGLWLNRDVALSWLRNGGEWMCHEFPREFENDKEMILTATRNDWEFFENASLDLLEDKDFAMEAIEVDGRIIRDLRGDIRYDEEVVTLAFSKEARAIPFYSHGVHQEDFEFLVSLAARVRERIDEYDTFQSLILTNTAKAMRNPQSVLGSLNQGPDSIRHFIQRIGSYVGLPSPSELNKLRQASKNLCSWGF